MNSSYSFTFTAKSFGGASAAATNKDDDKPSKFIEFDKFGVVGTQARRDAVPICADVIVG